MSKMSDLPYNPANIKVLIVDDHDLMRRSIAKVLRKSRFEEIYECSNQREAIEIYKAHVIDLVFCDIYMEKGDGFELLSFIRNQDTNSDIPFVVVTGESSKEGIVKAANLGAEDYVLKPFQAQDIEKKTHQVLGQYHSPSPLLHHIRRAERLLISNQVDEAKESVEKALQIDPSSSRVNHLKALILDAMKQTRAAIAVLNDSITQNPSFLKNYSTLADMYLKVGEIPQAIKALQCELKLNPKQGKRQIQLGRLLCQSGDYDGAVEHYRLALIEDSKDAAALFEIGQAFAGKGNLEKATYYFKRLRRQNPAHTKSLEALVKHALKLEQPRMAEIMLLDEKKNFPARLDVYAVLAKLYLKMDRSAEALAVVDEALKRNPDCLDALKVKALIFQHNKEADKAIEVYYKIITKTSDEENYFRLGELLLVKEDYFEALNILQQGLKVASDPVKILYLIVNALAKTRQFTKAYFIYKKLFQLGFKEEKTVANAQKVKKILIDRRSPEQVDEIKKTG
jgi:tetratricopeptide (TPR) repeat protein